MTDEKTLTDLDAKATVAAPVVSETPQHPGHQALLAVTDGPLLAVVQHHEPRPVMSSYEPTRVAYWQCHGCDPGPHPEDYADWPCSTVHVVAEQLGLPPIEE